MNEPAQTASDYAQTSLRDLTTRYFDLLEADLRDRRSGKLMTLGRALDRLAVSELRADFTRRVDRQRARHDALQHERPDLPPIGMSPAQAEATQHLARAARQLDERGHAR